MMRFETTVWGVLAAVVLALAVAGCSAPEPAAERSYSVTIPPLGMIISALCGDRAEVHVLLRPGDSPHTFEPKPSQARSVDDSLALFLAGDDLDGWAGDLGSVEKVALFPLVPEELRRELPHECAGGSSHGHNHGAMDMHFWLSPRTVREMLPDIVAELVRLDPQGEEDYRNNMEELDAELTLLHSELTRQLAPYNGRKLLLFHPSLIYLMEDFGLQLGGIVEAVPGKEPTPKLITGLVEQAHKEDIPGIFTEPQLPRKPAEAIARETNLPLFELDPIGGIEGRLTYPELIRYNADTIVAAFEGGGTG